jgi:hypothetical protein
VAKLTRKSLAAQKNDSPTLSVRIIFDNKTFWVPLQRQRPVLKVL